MLCKKASDHLILSCSEKDDLLFFSPLLSYLIDDSGAAGKWYVVKKL